MQHKLLHFGNIEKIFFDPSYDDEFLDKKDPKIKRLKELTRIFMDTELTEKQRTCVKMRYLEDKSVEEIAAALNIRPTTVYKHLKIAKWRIKKCWKYL